MRVICAWCPAVIRDDDSDPTVLEVSHGICPSCKDKIEADARASNRRINAMARVLRANRGRETEPAALDIAHERLDKAKVRYERLLEEVAAARYLIAVEDLTGAAAALDRILGERGGP